jgi:two-component system response regulator (stage 0 sporulation protein F)
MTITPTASPVLIVTRERLLGGLLCEVLKARGYRCTLQTNPLCVLEGFLVDTPRLTIVDLASLNFEGLEIIEGIRRVDAGAVVVAIVEAGMSPLKSAAYALGIADVVNRHEDVSQVLERIVNDRQQTAPAPVLDQPVTALVVDDEPAIRRLLERILTREGYAVLTAGDGIEALECLERRLPRLGGLSVLRRLREHPSPPRTVVMSGLADLELMQEVVTLGAFDYLHKPLSIDRVLVIATSGLVLDGIRR